MTHADGCPAAHNPRHGCTCRGWLPVEIAGGTTQTSSTDAVSSYPPPRVLPTSRGPGEEREYGAPTDKEEKMCGCDCCQNSDPTCFDPDLMIADGLVNGWVCKCSCPNCIANVIRGATNTGYVNGVATSVYNSFTLGRATGRAEALDVVDALPVLSHEVAYATAIRVALDELAAGQAPAAPPGVGRWVTCADGVDRWHHAGSCSGEAPAAEEER